MSDRHQAKSRRGDSDFAPVRTPYDHEAMKSSVGPGTDPALPDLVGIGAMKCGTSSLHYYLGLHPEIQMSQPKELHFFLDSAAFQPQDFGGIRKTLIELCNWHRGVDWYAQHFSPDAAVRGESTVA